MTRGRCFAAVLVAGQAWGLSGCSLLTMDRAPPRTEWASETRARCSGPQQAGFDIVMAGLIPLASSLDLSDTPRDATNVALAAGLGSIVFLLSATSGVYAAETCAEYQETWKPPKPSAAKGRRDQPCRANRACDPGLVCSAPGPLCRPAPGALGGRCISPDSPSGEATCDPGLTCVRELCEASAPEADPEATPSPAEAKPGP